MDLLYRALGMASAVNLYLWRHRINFVPLNMVLGGVAGGLLVFAADDWTQAVRNGRTPLTLPVARLADRPEAATFVRFSGTLLPGAGFWYGERDDRGMLVKASMEFVPLVDAASGRGVLVQLNVPHRFQAEQTAEITGMLREMRPFVSRELEPTNYRHNGIDYLRGFVLVDGDEPGDLGTAQLTIAITGTLLLLGAVVTLNRHTFFRRHVDPDPNWHQPGGGGSVRATGTFVLGKHRKHFIDVPAIFGRLDTGELALFANIDASSDFMGAKYHLDRAGVWTLKISPGTLQRVEQGTLYYGARAWPSVRFRYRDAPGGRERVAILSTPDGALHELASALATGALDAWSKELYADAPHDISASTHPHLSF